MVFVDFWGILKVLVRGPWEELVYVYQVRDIIFELEYSDYASLF